MLAMRFTITKHSGLAALLFYQLTAGQRLHHVDLSDMECHDSTGRSEIFISLRDLPAGDTDTPHVLTFFRSEDSKVAIEFELRDGEDIPVIERRTVHLLALQSDKDGHSNHSKPGRRLAYSAYSSSYRGSLDGGFSRSSSSSYGRRRGYGGGKSSWASSASGVGSVGSVGVEANLLQGRYPGGFSKTDYGWSGAKALVAGSVLGYPMAACTVDARACRDYMSYRGMKGALQQIKDDTDAKHELDQCEVEDTSSKKKGAQKWKGSCKKCFKDFPAHLCTVRFRPQKDLNRDDLMELGFIPSHHQSPLKLIVYKVRGPDYTRDRICASHESKKSSKDPETSHPVDVFVVLSMVDAVSESQYEFSLFRDHPRTTSIMIAAAVLCCCCWGGCMFFFWSKLRGLKEDEDDENNERDTYNQVIIESPRDSDMRSISRGDFDDNSNNQPTSCLPCVNI